MQNFQLLIENIKSIIYIYKKMRGNFIMQLVVIFMQSRFKINKNIGKLVMKNFLRVYNFYSTYNT